jgi:hypothetical protein
MVAGMLAIFPEAATAGLFGSGDRTHGRRNHDAEASLEGCFNRVGDNPAYHVVERVILNDVAASARANRRTGSTRLMSLPPIRLAGSTDSALNRMEPYASGILMRDDAPTYRRARPSFGLVGAFWWCHETRLAVRSPAWQIRQSTKVTDGSHKLQEHVTGSLRWKLRPVEAVQAWLAAAGITEGPVFRPVLKGSRLQAAALSPHSAAQIVKQYAKLAGLDPAGFAGPSR